MTVLILLFIYILRKLINFNIQEIEINDSLSDKKRGFECNRNGTYK